MSSHYFNVLFIFYVYLFFCCHIFSMCKLLFFDYVWQIRRWKKYIFNRREGYFPWIMIGVFQFLVDYYLDNSIIKKSSIVILKLDTSLFRLNLYRIIQFDIVRNVTFIIREDFLVNRSLVMDKTIHYYYYYIYFF